MGLARANRLASDASACRSWLTLQAFARGAEPSTRVLILWRIPEGSVPWAAAGTIANHGDELEPRPRRPDRAGEVPRRFRTTLGRTRDPSEESPSKRSGHRKPRPRCWRLEVRWLISSALHFWNFDALGMQRPPALRPLLCSGLSCSDSRGLPGQALITLDRPVRLFCATLLGLGRDHNHGRLGGGSRGDCRSRLGHVARLLGRLLAHDAATALVPALGWMAWIQHQGRLGADCRLVRGWGGIRGPPRFGNPPPIGAQLAARGLILAAWTVPASGIGDIGTAGAA